MSPYPRLTSEETDEHAHRLIEATFRVIATTGTTDPSVRPILQEAGLSRQALYRCFGSKENLMEAVLAQGRIVLADYLAARMDRASTHAGKLCAWIAGFMRQAEVAYAAERTRPFVVALGHQGANERTAFMESERLLIAPLMEIIAAGNQTGAWQSPDPAQDAQMIYSIVIVSLRRHLMLGISPPPKETQALGDFALRALSVPSPRSQ